MHDLVIIPVYNEAKNIAEVIPAICRHVDLRRVHILALDDGSTDGSARLIKGLTCLKLIRHKRNLGYGRTLLDGFAYAAKHRYRYVVTIDCDRQHQPAHIPDFFRRLSRTDVVSGSRYLRRVRAGEAPADRVSINREMTAAVNRLTGYKLTDAFCGFKGYRVAALKRLRLSEAGYGMPLEFWIKAAAAKLKVAEHPVELIYLDHRRRFRRGLDNPCHRRCYYRSVLQRALADVGWSSRWE